MSIEEIRALRDQLRHVNNKLEQAELYKTHFLSNIRNSIVNPFTSIISLGNEIVKTERNDWEKVVNLTAMISSEAFDLDFQFSNIFCTAEIEAGELRPEITNVNISNIVEQVVSKFRIKLDKKNIILLIDDNLQKENDPFIFCSDTSFLHIILSNLLNNAISFNTVGGKIEIGLSYEDNNLIIIVKDNGKGFDHAEKGQIFNRFERLNKEINSIESGHGLGLPIVKDLVDMLSGKIEIVSKSGEGAIFKMFFPKGQCENIDRGSDYLFENTELF